MSAGTLLSLPVAISIVGAVLAPLTARVNRRLTMATALLTQAAATVLLADLAVEVYGGHRVLTHFFSNERPAGGRVLGIAFVADPFGTAFAVLTSSVGLVLLLYVASELGGLGERELGALTCLMQLLLAALVGAGLTADLVNLFVWFEVASIAGYGLTGFFLERPIALEAAFKNVVLTTMAGFLIFVSAAMLYSSTGALNFGQLHLAAAVPTRHAQVVAVALLCAGFATKAGLVPFHGWLPDAHTPVPAAVSALFSGLVVALGVLGLVRISVQVFPGTHALAGVLTVLGIVSAVVGALLALVQDNLKRLLAWDTVSQTGIMIVGFESRQPDGVVGATYHLVNHALFKALLFLCAGAIVHATGVTKLTEMGGLARRRPLITTAFVVGCLSIAGVPPFNGYASLGLLHSGLRDEPALLALAILAQILTVAALGRAAYFGFLRRRAEPYERLERSGAGMRLALALLAAACIGFGVLATPFVGHVADPAAAMLLHPAAYAHAALGEHVSMPSLDVQFSYLEPAQALTTALELLAGLALLVAVVRRPQLGSLVTPLRKLHTGSVNDYAMYWTLGVSATAIALLAAAG